MSLMLLFLLLASLTSADLLPPYAGHNLVSTDTGIYFLFGDASSIKVTGYYLPFNAFDPSNAVKLPSSVFDGYVNSACVYSKELSGVIYCWGIISLLHLTLISGGGLNYITSGNSTYNFYSNTLMSFNIQSQLWSQTTRTISCQSHISHRLLRNWRSMA
jgi:hypothetical protein